MPSPASSVCWRGTEDVIAGLETACLHTSSVYTSGSHSSVVSSLSEASGTTSPTVAYGGSMAHFLRCSLTHSVPCLLLVIRHSIFSAHECDRTCVFYERAAASDMENICHQFSINAHIHSQVIYYIPDTVSCWI